MKILSGTEISQAIVDVRPTHIAVAYIGADWEEYLGEFRPEEIILSPTLGSNPFAIESIVEDLGWERVHLLTSLHAKVYLGAAHAVVGSCNLTKNALSGELLAEVAVQVQDKNSLSDLRTEFASLKRRAQQEFPTEASKRDAVRRLRRNWERAVVEGFVRPTNQNTPSILEYSSRNGGPFHVVWYRPDAVVELDSDVIQSSAPDLTDSVIGLKMTFLESDPIEEHQWLLCWAARQDGLPDLRVKPWWLFVHNVIPHGEKEDAPYTKLAVQRTDKKVPSFPFEIDDDVARALQDVLASRRFPELLRSTGDNWSVDAGFPRFGEFVETLKEAVSKKARPDNLQQVDA